MAAWSLPVVGLVVALGMTTLVWLASLVKRDASIIELFWGLGFVIVGWVYFAAGDGQALRQTLVVGLVTLWGARLSLHILWRNWGRAEDYRYREMREKNPEAFEEFKVIGGRIVKIDNIGLMMEGVETLGFTH